MKQLLVAALAVASLAIGAGARAQSPVPVAPVWKTVGTVEMDVFDMALKPSGDLLYVAGRTWGADAWLAAYDTDDGTERWAFISRFHTAGLAVAAAGNRVALGGWMSPTGSERDAEMSIWMLNAAGDNLWQRRFTGDGANRGDEIADVAFSPDGRTVYATGVVWFDGRRRDIVTSAYAADTGRLRWRRITDSGRSGSIGVSEEGRAIAVTPDGASVIVTGYNGRPAAGSNERSRAVTLALRASDGRVRWIKDSTASGDPDPTPGGRAVAVHGSAVYAAGGSWYGQSHDSFAARHALADGRRAWARVHEHGTASGVARAIVADGRGAYLAGMGGNLFQVWAQRASDGQTAWETPETLQGAALDVALDPGRLVYATGRVDAGSLAQGFVVYGFDRVTGNVEWTGEAGAVNGSGDAVLVDPEAGRIYAAGVDELYQPVIAAWDR